jgi:hypothetical protein
LVKIVINNANGHVSLDGESEIKIYPGANIKSIEEIKEPKNIRRVEIKTRNSDKVSKAVDENGEPLVVWHGTDWIFNRFEYDENFERGAHLVHDRHSFFFTGS